MSQWLDPVNIAIVVLAIIGSGFLVWIYLAAPQGREAGERGEPTTFCFGSMILNELFEEEIQLVNLFGLIASNQVCNHSSSFASLRIVREW